MTSRHAVFIAVLIGACSVFADRADAQSAKSFEIGMQLAAVRLSGIDATDAGLGGHAGWILTDSLTLEAAGIFFPTGYHDVPRGGRKVFALVGPKIGWRAARAGVFLKTRAGVARVGEGRQFAVCVLIFPPPEGCYVGETRLAFDLGGVVEVYPSQSSSLRLDIGDMATRLGTMSSRFGRRGTFANDLHVAAGLGFRF